MYNVGEIENGIVYRGYVDFKIGYRGKYHKKIRKNSGTKFLRDLICEALHGSINVNAKLPRYMNIVYECQNLNTSGENIGDPYTVQLLINPVPIATRSLGELVGSDEKNSILRLSSVISFADIVSSKVDFSNSNLSTTKIRINNVKLLLEDINGNVLAEIADNYTTSSSKWESDDIINLYKSICGSPSSTSSNDDTKTQQVDGVDAMIEWKLVFSNGTVGGEG